MNYKNTIGYGALLWIIIFVIVSAFVGFKIYDLPFISMLISLIAGAISYILARYVKPKNIIQALAFGLSWALVGIILDLIITMRFNPAIFQAPEIWFSYALIFLVPTLTIKK